MFKIQLDDRMFKRWAMGTTTVGALIGVAAGYTWRRYPAPFPHSLRFFLRHPLIGSDRLLQILAPEPDEHLLEIGPGTGYYALPVAAELNAGHLDILDIQPAMLEHTLAAARARGLHNLTPTHSSGISLPYPDNSFDGAYLSEVIGEIPDQRTALQELHRVIRRGGRLVVGESLLSGDVHFTTFSATRRHAEAAGFSFERRLGSPLGYFARFRV